MAQGDNAQPLTISEISALLKRTVEDRFGFVRLRGELSGVKRAASGHFYCARPKACTAAGDVVELGAGRFTLTTATMVLKPRQ